MPRVLFKKNWDWRPTAKAVIAFKQGGRYLVTTRCAKQAIDRGVAELEEATAQRYAFGRGLKHGAQ